MENPQYFKVARRLADKAVQKLKLEEQQKTRPTVKCEDEELEKGFPFNHYSTGVPMEIPLQKKTRDKKEFNYG